MGNQKKIFHKYQNMFTLVRNSVHYAFTLLKRERRGMGSFLLGASLTAGSAWLLTSPCPHTGRRKLSLLPGREAITRVILNSPTIEDREEEVRDRQELADSLLTVYLEDKIILPRSHPYYSQLERVSTRLVTGSPNLPIPPPAIHVTIDPTMTGSSLGRHVILSSWMLEAFTDDQLAFVLGHEMAHSFLEHHAEGLALAMMEVLSSAAVLVWAWRSSSARVRRVSTGLLPVLLWLLVSPVRFLLTYPVRGRRRGRRTSGASS